MANQVAAQTGVFTKQNGEVVVIYQGQELDPAEVLTPWIAPVQTSADISAAAQAVTNNDAKRQLLDFDAASVRSMREFILAKFGTDPLLNPVLAAKDSAAATQRARIK